MLSEMVRAIDARFTSHDISGEIVTDEELVQTHSVGKYCLRKSTNKFIIPL